MSKMRSCSIVLGFVVVLGLAGASQAEDTIRFGVNCGGACGIGTQASSDTVLPALPGGTFVITLAHLAPSPEDAFVRGRPIECRPVELRVDTLRIGGRDGSIAVEVGEKLELKAGESARIVHAMDQNTGAVGPDMDQLTFRLRADRVSSRCDLIASGMFYADDGSAPTPFSLLVNDGAKRPIWHSKR